MFYELAAIPGGQKSTTRSSSVIAVGPLHYGRSVAAFEVAFAAYHGSRYAVMVNSGSSANLIAIAAYSTRRERPLQRGDEVMVPAISWATTYHPLQQYGLKLRILDVELDTFNMDVSRSSGARPHTARSWRSASSAIRRRSTSCDISRRADSI